MTRSAIWRSRVRDLVLTFGSFQVPYSPFYMVIRRDSLDRNLKRVVMVDAGTTGNWHRLSGSYDVD